MNVAWIAVGITVAAVTVTATILRLVTASRAAPTNPDLGTVSEGWLSENRSRKEP
jgi:hypothetical protein